MLGGAGGLALCSGLRPTLQSAAELEGLQAKVTRTLATPSLAPYPCFRSLWGSARGGGAEGRELPE